MKKISLLLIIAIYSSFAFSQVVISGLQSNSILEKLQQNSFSKSNQTHQYTAVTLPFVDDFSIQTTFPDSAKWINNQVFINNDYAYRPLTIGVATFDALDGFGKIYSTAQSTAFAADTLTSRPIRLDSIFNPTQRAITLADSVYFSFYYQPGGGIGQPWELRGDKPELGDSLLLEFGYFTGNFVYSYSEYQPQILTSYMNLGDSIQSQCYPELWLKASHVYQANDTMMVACDSVLVREMVWSKVWGAGGSSLKQMYDSTGKYFKQVMIPVTNINYLNAGFQFRFRNIASMGNNTLPGWLGNVDQWNIDYVKLNINRSASDTLLKDVAFACSAPTTLKNYQLMPWTQFKGNQTAELTDSLSILLTNLDNIVKNTSYTYEATTATGGSIYIYNGGSFNIDPYDLSGYQTYQPHARPPIKFTYPEDAQDSASFLITHTFKEAGGADQRNENDTIRFAQNFYNFYAYDDGTAENGFGLSPAGSRLAYKFSLNNSDTLRAVNMFFNRTLDNSNVQYFWLTIWNEIGGKPGNVIYEQNNMRPVFGDSLNQYITYELNQPLALSGAFYIGWRQTTADNLNVGFDRNNNVSSKIFFNTGSAWENTFYTGALMMRPVLGKKYSGVQIEENSKINITIYPNPNSGDFFIANFPETQTNLTYKIIDITGRFVAQNQLQHTNEIHLQSGVYLIQVMDKNQMIYNQKLIISK
jgi:hypothetical protein